ncbi:MAG: MFS transporter [Halieaceae bacterium]|jgi:MFS family permease|nr:MFS transporter [Halieaceae bacterium]
MSFLAERRWQVAVVLMVTFFVGFMDRINITFALPLMAREFGWDDADTRYYGSLLMGVFYGAYGLANILLSPLAARLGVRRSLMLIVCLWSLFTALGAWVSQWMMLLVASRMLLGLSEGVHVPMMTTATKAWFPLEERARANAIVVAGIFLAILLAPLLLVPLMGGLGWRAGFLFLAAAGGLVSLPLIAAFVFDTPDRHPRIGEVERAALRAGRDRESAGERSGQLLRQLLTTPTALLFFCIGTLNNLLAIGLSSWLPTYFTLRRGIPYEEITWLVVMPYAFSLVGLALWSFLGDRFNVRSLVAGLGFVGAALAIYMALKVENLTVVIACMTAAVFCISAFAATEYALIQRIFPMDNFAPAMGLYNGLTSLVGGGLGPALMSPLIGDGSGTWLISVIALLTASLLLLYFRLVRY